MEAIQDDGALARGVNTYQGHITHAAVAAAFGRKHTPIEQLL